MTWLEAIKHDTLCICSAMRYDNLKACVVLEVDTLCLDLDPFVPINRKQSQLLVHFSGACAILKSCRTSKLPVTSQTPQTPRSRRNNFMLSDIRMPILLVKRNATRLRPVCVYQPARHVALIGEKSTYLAASVCRVCLRRKTARAALSAANRVVLLCSSPTRVWRSS